MFYMSVDKQKAKNAFAQYVRNYNTSDEKIRLKIEHTYKVCGLCEIIAKDIGLSDEEIDIAWLIGLLHDIGRFEQVRKYGTFSDAQSIDHAVYGAQILFDDGKIRDYILDSSIDSLIRTAIETHSLYKLPDNLDEHTKMFCDIIRDADKIDIMRVNVETPLEEIYNVSSKDLMNSPITPEVMQSFYEEHATLRSLKKTPIDNLVGHISLVYELVYPISTRLVHEQGFLEKMMSFESDNPQTREQFSQIRAHITEFINNKINKGGI